MKHLFLFGLFFLISLQTHSACYIYFENGRALYKERLATKKTKPTFGKQKSEVKIRYISTKSKPKREKNTSPHQNDRPVHWCSIASILMVFLGFAGILPAIIFGIIGMIKSGEGKRFRGKGWAIAGFTFGILGLLMALLLLFLLLLVGGVSIVELFFWII